MQKKLKLSLVVVCFAVAASLVFVACGNGDPTLLDSILKDDLLENADNKLWENVSSMAAMSWGEEESSSSEGEEPSSSSESQSDKSSSSEKDQGKSSSSGSKTSSASTQSSSSNPPPKSSSSIPAPTGSCTKSNEKSGFTCKWDKSGVVMPGTVIKPVATGGSGCTIKWNYKTSPLSTTCKGSTDEDGLKAEGNASYVLFAELECDDGKHVNACEPTGGLATKEAPYLEGDCKWSRPTNETTTARGAVPSGISLKDVDDVCTNSNKTIVYKYDDLSKDWPKEGGPLPEAKTYSDVQATVACSGTGYTYDVTPAEPCPPLKALAGADHQISCAGDQIGEKTCKNYQLKVQNDECIDLEIDWENKDYHPDVSIVCEGQFTGNTPTSSISIKVGETPAVTKSGDYYVSTSASLASKLQVGKKEVNGICVSYKTTGTAPATGVTCKLN